MSLDLSTKQQGFIVNSPFFTAKTQHFLAILSDIAVLVPVFLLIYTWRGFIQTLAAKIMGDDTAQEHGFLTLNPLAHIDLYGFLILMGVYFFLGGFFYESAIRSVLLILIIMLGVQWTIRAPIDDSRFTHYRLGGIITSLSGPIAHFTLAFLVVCIVQLCKTITMPLYVAATLASIFHQLIDIALFFGLIDLIPIPPLDGGRLLRYALPASAQSFVDKLEEYSFYIIIGLFFIPGIRDVFFKGILIGAFLIKHGMLSIFS